MTPRSEWKNSSNLGEYQDESNGWSYSAHRRHQAVEHRSKKKESMSLGPESSSNRTSRVWRVSNRVVHVDHWSLPISSGLGWRKNLPSWSTYGDRGVSCLWISCSIGSSFINQHVYYRSWLSVRRSCDGRFEWSTRLKDKPWIRSGNRMQTYEDIHDWTCFVRWWRFFLVIFHNLERMHRLVFERLRSVCFPGNSVFCSATVTIEIEMYLSLC